MLLLLFGCLQVVNGLLSRKTVWDDVAAVPFFILDSYPNLFCLDLHNILLSYYAYSGQVEQGSLIWWFIGKQRGEFPREEGILDSSVCIAFGTPLINDFIRMILDHSDHRFHSFWSCVPTQSQLMDWEQDSGQILTESQVARREWIPRL